MTFELFTFLNSNKLAINDDSLSTGQLSISGLDLEHAVAPLDQHNSAQDIGWILQWLTGCEWLGEHYFCLDLKTFFVQVKLCF